MFAYPALGGGDPLAAYRAAQAERVQAAQPQAPATGLAPPPSSLPPVQVLAPPGPVPRWVVIGGAVIGVTVLGLVAYALLGRRK